MIPSTEPRDTAQDELFEASINYRIDYHTLITGERLPTMDTIKRSTKTHNKPAKGTVLPDAAFKGATVHEFTRSAKSTRCGKVVDLKDARWKTNAAGKETDINCKRCKKARKDAAKAVASAKPKAARKASKKATPSVASADAGSGSVQ